MKRILIPAAAALALLASPAHAVILDPYVSAGLGFGTQRSDGENHRKTALNAELGLDIPFVRAGIEYSLLDRVGDGPSVQSVMVNGYFKFLPLPIVKPYIGLGYGRLLSQSKNAYQGILGIGFTVIPSKLYLDAEGRVLFSNGAIDGGNLWHYDGRMKLRYHF
jgi:hypothetical protein